MPITLSQIANNTASVSFPFGEETITLAYYPGRITEKTFAQMEVLQKMDEASTMEAFADFNAMLANLIKSWDIFEDDAQTVMFPIDPARFSELPIGIRAKAMQSIMADVRPE